MSLNYLATRYTCSWPWQIAVLLCDGRIVCGCADPYAKRVLGDVRISTGEYLLKFDLVSEGIDWFEACGSEPTVAPLIVG